MIIGLTGGIGSGKTTTSNYFAELGADIIDADVIARELTAPGQPALKKIHAHFGSQVIHSNGSLNRTALRHVIFDAPTEKIWLENLLHPLVRKTIKQRSEQSTAPYCLVVIPLLTESGHYDFLERICLVDCDETIQRNRASQRDNQSPDKIQAIMDSQATRQQRLAIADDIITNNGNLNQLKQQIKQLHYQYSGK